MQNLQLSRGESFFCGSSIVFAVESCMTRNMHGALLMALGPLLWGRLLQASRHHSYNLLDTVMMIQVCHEYGHSQEPFNELSDSLCTWCLDVGDPGVYEHTPVHHWPDSGATEAQWCLVLALSEAERTQYPVVIENDNAYLTLVDCLQMS